MKTVSIINPLEMYSRMRGVSRNRAAFIRKTAYFVLPLLFVFGLWALMWAKIPADKIKGMFFLSISIIAALFLFGGGRYKPQKSFFFWRLSKERMNKYYTCLIICCIAITAILFVLKITKPFFALCFILFFISLLYYVKKSFTVHEDIDYVTNNDVSNLFGLEIDEKIQASYQNFSIPPIENGSNMLILTDKKVIFTFFDGYMWSIMNKQLKDIVEIGWVSMIAFMVLQKSSSLLYFKFSDNTTVELHMDLLDKLTSNPDLFFKKFLITFDTLLLGKADEKIASRRRISVNRDTDTSMRTDDIPNTTNTIRSIDISSTILDNLRNAVPVESGRVLEF